MSCRGLIPSQKPALVFQLLQKGRDSIRYSSRASPTRQVSSQDLSVQPEMSSANRTVSALAQNQPSSVVSLAFVAGKNANLPHANRHRQTSPDRFLGPSRRLSSHHGRNHCLGLPCLKSRVGKCAGRRTHRPQPGNKKLPARHSG